MDLLTYLRILRRRLPLILAVTVAGAVLGSATALLDSSSAGGAGRTYYKASNVSFFEPSQGSQSSISSLQQLAVLTVSGDVPRLVGAELGEQGARLGEQVIVTTNQYTNTFDITAISSDARESERIADTFAKELLVSVAERDQTRFDTQRDRIVKRLDDLQTQIAELDAQALGAPNAELLRAQRDGLVNQYRLTYEQFQQLADDGAPTPPLSQLETAQAVPIDGAEYAARLQQGQLGQNVVGAGDPSGGVEAEDGSSSTTTFDGPISRGALGGFLGLMGGIGLALIVERLDRRARSRQEVEDAYGLEVLAEVPPLTEAEQRDETIVSHTLPLSRTAEAHRSVRSALLFQHSGDHPHEPDGAEGAAMPPLVVLVTSAIPAEGKSTTTANLAAVFAESGASVLAVNCDFRRPSLHRLLGAPLEERRVLTTNVPGVKLVSAVAPPTANPSQVIEAQRRLIATARERFDVILLDAAPLLTTNDAVEVIGSADLVLLVARTGVTTTDGAARARVLLERVRGPISGVVLVGDESSPGDPYYYYSRTLGQEPAADLEFEDADLDLDASATTRPKGRRGRKAAKRAARKATGVADPTS